jgi:hypothetical protein
LLLGAGGLGQGAWGREHGAVSTSAHYTSIPVQILIISNSFM